jgi:ribose 5-phosphate isomerase A
MTDPAARLKQQAGELAAGLVQSGMVIGLGTGSTAIFATRRIAERLRAGELGSIVAVATSSATDEAARSLGIPMLAEDIPRDIDLTIDGADEVDPVMGLIKGGGGALLREKIVAQASRREVIVVDESKLSPALGTLRALPVEVLEFGWRSQLRFLESLGATVTLRTQGDGPYRTDGGNMILDSRFGAIADAPSLAAKLEARAGIIAHGLFLGLAQDVIVAGAGCVRHVRRGEKMPVLLALLVCLICVTPAVAASPAETFGPGKVSCQALGGGQADCLLSASRITNGNRNETSFSLATLPPRQRAQFRKWCLHPSDECTATIQGRREFPQASRLATVTALQWHRPRAPRNEAAAAH